MATFATWMLRRRSDAQFVWQKQGAAPPEVVVDPKAYQETFSNSFPQIHITWGPGDFEMLVSSADGGTYKVGSVKTLTAPDFSTENRAMVVAGQAPKLQLRDEGDGGHIQTGARIAGDLQEEANSLLGKAGIPGGVQTVDSFQQPGLDQGGTLASHFKGQDAPRNNTPAHVEVLKASTDTPDYILLLRNVKRQLLPMDTTFAARLRALPDLIVEHVRQNPEGTNLTDEPMRGRKFTGLVEDGTRYQLATDTFLGDDCSRKTRAYIRWWLNYQDLEAQLNSHVHGYESGDMERCFQLSLEMVLDATELYLLEKGWDANSEEPIPYTEIHKTVREEMEARATFLADKDLEYGQPTRRHGLQGVVIRVFDKISRYTTLKAGNMVPKFESTLDSLKDLGGYSMILAGAIQEELDRVNRTTTSEVDA